MDPYFTKSKSISSMAVSISPSFEKRRNAATPMISISSVLRSERKPEPLKMPPLNRLVIPEREKREPCDCSPLGAEQLSQASAAVFRGVQI